MVNGYKRSSCNLKSSALSPAATCWPGAPTWKSKRSSGATNGRKLAAVASLFDYPCDCNAVLHNPVNGMKRPAVDTLEGKTPALGDA